MKTCTVEGCLKKYVARGLCSTHYNRAMYTPEQRHAKVVVECGWCAKPHEKMVTAKFADRFCSYDCRDTMRAYRSGLLVSEVPRWHRAHPQYEPPLPVLYRPQQVTVGPTKPRQTKPRWIAGECRECGSHFVDVWLAAGSARYCSKRCRVRVSRRSRDAREHGARGDFTWTEFMRVFLLFDRRCAYCIEVIDGQPDPDHVIPLSRDGHNTIGNILPACRACNCDKRDVLLHEWNDDRARRGLPPRITAWNASDVRYAHLTAQYAA